MKANPGGHIPPSEVVGRDDLIYVLWRTLERQSVVLSAERRMGKTCIIKKMVAEPPEGSLPIFRDLERIQTPLEFAELVFEDVEKYLSGIRRTATKTRQFLSQLAGVEVGSLVKIPQVHAQHWKTMLAHTIEDLVEHQERKIIFFWDELPLMVYNIKQKTGEAAAMEVLDALRALRQTNETLRMVFTGSIGLHNVITALKRAGYANSPTNDMYKVDVPPLSVEKDATSLALQLLKGEAIYSSDAEALAGCIAEIVDGIPFYIQHIVVQLALSGADATQEQVREIVGRFLVEDQDPWELRYFRERINTYYTEDERPFALNMLDILAGAEDFLSFETLFNRLKLKLATEDAELARHVLTLLQLDHYITRNPEGAYRFRFAIIRRWWQLERGI